MAAVRGEVPVEEVDPERLLERAQSPVIEAVRSGMAAAQSVSGQVAQIDTKIRLNAMKVLTPAIAAVIYRPGMDGESDDKKAALAAILASTNSVSAEVCRIIDPEAPLPKWAESNVKVAVAEIVATQWREKGNADISVHVDLMRGVSEDHSYKELLSSLSSESFHKPESESDASTMLHMSFLNGAAKIYREIVNFSFWADQRVLLDRLMEKCAEIARIDCASIESASDVMHYQSAFGRAVDLMQAEYRATARTTVDELVAADDRGEYGAVSRQVKENVEKIISQIESRAERGFKSLLAAANRMVELQMQRKPQEGNAHGFKS